MNLVIGNEKWIQAAAFYLRYQVFVLEQKISAKEEFDRLDDDFATLYLVYYNKSQPVATLRYQKIDEKTFNPDRFCVSECYRNQGIGKQLLLDAEKKAANEGCTTSVLSAEVTAQAFYEKMGYRVISPTYMEDGILCVKVEKRLNRYE